MKLKLSSAILVCLVSIVSGQFKRLQESSVGFVRIYTEDDFGGQMARIKYTDCASEFPEQFVMNISSIHTENNCVNLYKEEDCDGEYILMKPGTPVHNNLSYWADFNNNIKSIGPCFSACDVRNIENLSENNKSTPISLYSYSDYKGHKEDLDVHEGCVVIPRRMKGNVKSIKIYESLCIELHEFRNCAGKSAQLRKDSPFHWDLKHWSHINLDGSVSLCGHNCTRASEGPSSPIIAGGGNSVIIYDALNYEGNGCVNVANEWEGESLSINRRDKCITIFELTGCNENGKVLDLDESNPEVQQNLSIRNFDRLVRSLKICGNSRKTVPLPLTTVSNDANTTHTFIYLVMIVLIISLIGCMFVIFRLQKINRENTEASSTRGLGQFPARLHDPDTGYDHLL